MLNVNLSWAEGLAKARQELTSHRGLWPTVAFRLLTIPRKDRWLDVLVGHFQTTTLERSGALDPIVEAPTVFEGVMTEFQFASLLDSWSRGDGFEFGKWVFWPPEMRTLAWSEDLTQDALWGVPLLSPLPARQTGYLVHRAAGGGTGQVPEITKGQVTRAAWALQKALAQWSLDYLGLHWDGNTTYLLIHMPVPVALEASYDPSTEELLVHVYYRKPYTAKTFWARVGDRWAVTLPAQPFTEDSYDEAGWHRSSLALRGIAYDDRLKIWVGTDKTPNQFRWQASLPKQAMGTPQRAIEEWKRWRLQFMNHLYELAGPSTGNAQDTYKIAAKLEIPRLEALHVMQYLVDEGLIKEYGAGRENQALVVLTHDGIREVEAARDKPSQPTTHFPPYNSVTVTGDLKNSQIQVGTSYSTQHGVFLQSDQREEVAAWVEQVSARLTAITLAPDDLADVRAQLATMNAQLSSPKPRHAALAAGATAIKGVLETAAAAATVTPPAVAAIDFLLTHFPRFLGP
jgi:hypothetical protein